MSCARDIIEAETPKGVFQSVIASGAHVGPTLERARWYKHGSGWAVDTHSYDRDPDKQGNYAKRQFTVWKDGSVWVLKMEGEKLHFGRYCGWYDLGLWEWQDANKMLDWMRRSGILEEPVKEAEDPKDFIKRNAHEYWVKDLLRQAELEDTPWPDSYKEGQRVRRTRLNPFGARPHGGNPNDIGDLGTIVRFIGRKEEPQHSLYLVRWDRNGYGTEYCDHRNTEAVDAEVE